MGGEDNAELAALDQIAKPAEAHTGRETLQNRGDRGFVGLEIGLAQIGRKPRCALGKSFDGKQLNQVIEAAEAEIFALDSIYEVEREQQNGITERIVRFVVTYRRQLGRESMGPLAHQIILFRLVHCPRGGHLKIGKGRTGFGSQEPIHWRAQAASLSR